MAVRVLGGLVLGLVLLAGWPALAQKEDRALQAKLADIVAQERERSGVPALGVAVLTGREGVRAIAVTGERVAGSGDAVGPDDLWHVGSCTKAITAAMYARAVEDGDQRWGVSVAALFPALPADEAWSGITIEEVFGHRSGIRDVGLGFLLTGRDDARTLEAQRLALVGGSLARKPAVPRGAFAYSNMAYILAGAALEKGGEPWEVQAGAFLRRVGLKPAEFGFGPPQGDQPVGHRKKLFGQGFASVGQGKDADNPLAMGPAGTAHLSLRGWAKFVRLFLTDGGGVLSAESIERLTEPVEAETDDAVYALGWGIVEDENWGLMWTHAGSNTAWLAQVVILPERDVAVLVVTNSAGGGAEKAVRAVTFAALSAATQ